MTSHTLAQQGVSQQLSHHYVKAGWLQRVAHGLFARPGERPGWQAAVITQQSTSTHPIHVGGKSALAWLGIRHFVPLANGHELWLFGRPNQYWPAWLTGKKVAKLWSREIHCVSTQLFDDDTLGIEHQPVEDALGSAREILVSSKERAVLELLFLVPQKQTLEEAKYLLEGLTTLRPHLLQALLEQCRSIKVKRLFLFLANFCQLPCVEHLVLSSIDLGKGKRVIGTGGHYVSEYQLSIPSTFVNTFKDEFEYDQ